MHFLTMHPTRSCLIPQTFVFCVFFPVCSCLHKTSPTTSTPGRRQWQEDFGKMFAYFLLKFRWQDGNQSICSLWWIWSYTSQRRHTHHLLSLWIHKSNPPQKSTPMRRRGQKALFLRQRLVYKRSLRPKHWPFLINQCRREKNLCKTHSFSLKYEATASSR